MLSTIYKHKNIGILILRLFIGVSFMFHGFPKLFSGVDKWEKLGSTMSHLGIDFLPIMWGFMGSASEFIGGFLFALGLFFKPASLFLALTMFVAFWYHFSSGDGFSGFNHALELFAVFAGFFFIGPGTFSLDQKFRGK
jgi:putative oxidoreductase